MKNSANVKRFYAMNLADGRIILVTRELLTNPDYRVVAAPLAREIEAGRKDWRTVAFALRQNDNLSAAELLKRAEQEKVKNLRPSVVTRENVEQFETKLSEGEVGPIYDGMDVADTLASGAPADGGVAPEGQQKPVRKSGKRKQAPASGAPADGGVSEETVAEDLIGM